MPETVLLKCEAVRWVSDEPWPGWVEVQLTDAGGRRWSLFDKPPIFEYRQRLSPAAAFPVEAVVRCQVIGEGVGPDGQPVVTVSTWVDGVQHSSGRAEFDVRPDRLLPG